MLHTHLLLCIRWQPQLVAVLAAAVTASVSLSGGHNPSLPSRLVVTNAMPPTNASDWVGFRVQGSIPSRLVATNAVPPMNSWDTGNRSTAACTAVSPTNLETAGGLKLLQSWVAIGSQP